MTTTVLYLLPLLFFESFTQNQNNPRVTLPSLTVIEGNELIFDDNTQHETIVEEYLGIPYAEAPIGPLRFRAPVPINAMASQCSIFEAKKYGHACLQSLGPIDEKLVANWWNPSIMVW